jgi:hypothetical protein
VGSIQVPLAVEGISSGVEHEAGSGAPVPPVPPGPLDVEPPCPCEEPEVAADFEPK